MSFTSDITRFSVFAKGVSLDTRREASIALFSAVIQDSPVGNPELWKSQQSKPIKDRKGPNGYTGGRFRANWICTINHPAIGTVNSVKFDNVENMIQTIKTLSDDQPLFLANNLPYAQTLEDGHSTQAPQGFVKRNVSRIQSIMIQALREARRKNS